MLSKPIVGIDPGKTGAVAVLTNSQEFVTVLDMPILTDGKTSKVNARALAAFLIEHKPGLIIMERVNAMPPIAAKGNRRAGTQSSFNFGRNVGAIEAVCACATIATEYIQPHVWKGRMGLRGKEKDQARTKAIELFPDAAEYLQRKKDIGRADAILIAAAHART